MAGKFCSIRRDASATHLWTDFTKITTWKDKIENLVLGSVFYTDLVKFENIEELKQFPILLGILEFDVVLLETVEGQLGLVVNVDLVEDVVLE